MIRNYLQTASRNFLRYRLYTFINVLGLAIGIAFCLLIYLFIQYEFQYDSFHTQGERIYRVEKSDRWDNEPRRTATLSCPFVPMMYEEVPEVEDYSRYSGGSLLIDHAGKQIEQTVHYVDPGFFRMFSFSLLQGNPATIFAQPGGAVISSSLAQRYFGDEDPIGKIIRAKGKYGHRELTLVVNGVIEDAPPYSSLQTDFLISMEENGNCGGEGRDVWTSSSVQGFALLREGSQLKKVIQKTDTLLAKHYPYEIPPTSSLTPLEESYFDPVAGAGPFGNPQNSYVLGTIALLILLLACINYVLLALTNASSRTKEIGVRKVLGASRGALRTQYLIEAFAVTLAAVGLGLTLAQLFLPSFNEFSQRTLALNLVQNPEILLVLLMIAAITGLGAGGYPAYWLARHIPTLMLRGSTYRVESGLSSVLVMLQLAICVFFISCTLIMHRQLDYLANKDLGFDQELIVKIDTYNPEQIAGNTILQRFRQELDGDTRIQGVTGALGFPRFCCTTQFQYEDRQITTRIVYVDYDFFQMLNISISDGRGFSPEITTDSGQTVIINDVLADALGYPDPVGEIYPLDSSLIIGLVKDVYIGSLKKEVDAVVYSLGEISELLVKIDGTDIPGSIQQLEQTWKELISDRPLAYSFLDEYVALMYEDYQRWQRMVGLSTFFGLLIASMGLFGLSGLYSMNKAKEIAIRKVLGAGVGNLLLRLNQKTFRLFFLAFVLSVPLAYYSMQQWLSNFAFRIDLEWYWFAVSCGLGAVVCGLVVSYHTLKVTLANPVQSLRYE